MDHLSTLASRIDNLNADEDINDAISALEINATANGESLLFTVMEQHVRKKPFMLGQAKSLVAKIMQHKYVNINAHSCRVLRIFAMRCVKHYCGLLQLDTDEVAFYMSTVKLILHHPRGRIHRATLVSICEIAPKDIYIDQYKDLLNMFLNHKHANINECDGKTLLEAACVSKNEVAVNELLQQPCIDANAPTAEGNTALAIVLSDFCRPILDMLLNHENIDVNRVTRDGKFPLLNACLSGPAHRGYAVQRLLTRSDIDINKGTERDNITTLVLAIQTKSLDVVELLLADTKIDLNVVTKKAGLTPLHTAVYFDSIPIIKLLLADERINLNAVSKSEGYTALHYACRGGRTAIVQRLIEKGPKIELTKRSPIFGETPFYVACLYGSTPIVELLCTIENLNAVTKKGEHPLIAATSKGHTNTVKFLLTHIETNVNYATTLANGGTALILACTRNYLTIVELLLQRVDLKVNQTPLNSNCTALWAASAFTNDNIVPLLLRQRNIVITTVDETGKTPLFIACRNGHYKNAELLLQHNADVNTADDNGITPLYTACAKGYVAIVKLLLSQATIQLDTGVTIAGAFNNETPFAVAVRNNKESIVDYMILNHREDINLDIKIGPMQATPLYMACTHGHTGIVRLLLEQETASLNSKLQTDGTHDGDSVEGITPLWIAAKNRHTDIVELLLAQNGIDPNIARKSDGSTPLYTACDVGKPRIVEHLVTCPSIMVNKATTEGKTPLHIACEKASLFEVNKLLNHKDIDVKCRDNSGETPVSLLSAQKDTRKLEALLAVGTKIDVAGKSKDERTPLIIACHADIIRNAEVLIKYANARNIDIDVRHRDENGVNALYAACMHGNNALIKLVIGEYNHPDNSMKEDMLDDMSSVVELLDFDEDVEVEALQAMREAMQLNEEVNDHDVEFLYLEGFPIMEGNEDSDDEASDDDDSDD